MMSVAQCLRIVTFGVTAWVCTACTLTAKMPTPSADAEMASACVPAPLAGTQWKLVSITSMDDSQGVQRVADSTRFTLRLGADGQAALRLDCNRGTATWKAQAAGGESGSFVFGPIAATRALCAPPRLDEKVARDLGFVRSYLRKDGKLFMSLMADGGIYEWAPMPMDQE